MTGGNQQTKTKHMPPCTRTPPHPPTLCESNALVRATVGVASVKVWNHFLLCPYKSASSSVGVVSASFGTYFALVNPPPPRLLGQRLTVLYIVEHPNQEGDTCIDWTSQYCWTNGWNCLWRGHSVYRNRPLIPLVRATLDGVFVEFRDFSVHCYILTSQNSPPPTTKKAPCTQRSAVAERLHSALKSIAILQIWWCSDPPPMETQTRGANTAALVIFMNGEKALDAANCPESSNI